MYLLRRKSAHEKGLRAETMTQEALRGPDRAECKVQSSAQGQLGLERIVFFSDAVMAIAITLLAIDLKVPEIAASAASVELPRALSEMGPRFMSFIISFFVIGVYWMSHHRYFQFIQRYDSGLVVLNLLFLLFIVLMPFVAALFGQYYYLPLGMSLYAAAVAGTGLSMAVLWWYASHGHRLVDEHLDERFIRARSIALAVPLLFLVSIPFAFFSRTLAVAMWCTLPLVSYLVMKYAERKRGRA
jgi:uncharacterized membrane protein